MAMQESGEMYLETIHILYKKTGHVRSTDIAEYMGYSKPSVSRAVGLLKTNGFIEVDKNGAIRIRRFDYALKEEIGSAWILDPPTSENALKAYSADRANITNTFPVKDAEVSALGNGTTKNLRLAFTAADSSKTRVYYYEVTVKAANSGAVKTLKYATDFYLKPQAENMKNRWIMNLGSYTIGTTYTITVTPYNTWGVGGEAQTVTIDLT